MKFRCVDLYADSSFWNELRKDPTVFLRSAIDRPLFSVSFDKEVDRFFSFRRPIVSYFLRALCFSVFPERRKRNRKVEIHSRQTKPIELDPTLISVRHFAAFQRELNLDWNRASKGRWWINRCWTWRRDFPIWQRETRRKVNVEILSLIRSTIRIYTGVAKNMIAFHS